MNVKAALTTEECAKYLNSQLLEHFEGISENLSIFKLKRPNVVHDKAIYLGWLITESSKLTLYRLYYNHLKKFYGDRVSLCNGDTDSLFLVIETEDVIYRHKKPFYGYFGYE